MVAENFANFAITALVSPSTLSPSATSFVCTASQGTLFPSGNFVATMGSEILFVIARSGDTFSSVIRGYEGSTAVTHFAGETIQLCSTAGNWKHVWANLADTVAPQVPPTQLGSSPSAYDNEFESAGGWTLFPSPGGSTAFNAGVTLKSYLLLSRAGGDNTVYTAYIAYALTGAATFTMRLSQGVNTQQNVAGDQAQVSFFISDQTNPSGGADTGNRFKVNTYISTSLSGGIIQSPQIARAVVDSSGSPTIQVPSLPFAMGVPVYLRIVSHGNGVYEAYAGDGVVYWLIGFANGLFFTPQSIGVTFHSYRPSGSAVSHTAAVDFVRVEPGVTTGFYGV